MLCKLEQIFRRQAEYVASLRSIYLRNGFCHHAESMPWPLNDRDSQEEFRLLAWRCTEEVYEAIQVHRMMLFSNSLIDADNFREEVADALHFFVELCLATGVNSRDVIFYYEGFCVPEDSDALDHIFRFVGNNSEDGVTERWNIFVERLAKTMMLLKQRPWRTDDRRTDERRFKGAMASAFISFVAACKRSGINAESLYSAYFVKGKINDQRTTDQKL